MNRRRMLFEHIGFPFAPSGYSLIDTYSISGTFTAPEDGYFQIVLQGASGAGAQRYQSSNGNSFSGGGGGGGGCAISRVKLKKGDTVRYTLGKAATYLSGYTSATSAGDSSASINSSIEDYDSLSVTGAENGQRWLLNDDGLGGPPGGAGGVGSGGNYGNYTGSSGGDGDDITSTQEEAIGTAKGGSGGYAGYSGGNKGGKGEGWIEWELQDGSLGGDAFIMIYRGNTNKAG